MSAATASTTEVPGADRTRPPLPGPLGRWAASIYASVIARRNRAFDQGKGVTRLDRPVISVGNLSVGGTGKTPMVLYLVQALIEAGHRPCIAMRGYAARGGESDEAAEYRTALTGVPVIARPDRIAGLRELFAAQGVGGPTCVVLDDGFQHRRLARDMDIVLVDATHDPFEDRLLPAGWLREPPDSLARADAVVITHTESVPAQKVEVLRERIVAAAPRAVVAACRHEWTSLAVVEGGEERKEPLAHLGGRRVLAACAIGNPGPFLEQARRAVGGPLVGEFVLRDHDPFNRATVRELHRRLAHHGAQLLLVTGKDWSKLRRGAPAPVPVARPILSLSFDFGAEKLTATARACATVRNATP